MYRKQQVNSHREQQNIFRNQHKLELKKLGL